MSLTSTRDDAMHAKFVSKKPAEESGKLPDATRRGRPPKGESMPKYEKRLQIKLTDEGRERLDVLVSRVGADGIGEIVRDALRVYDILTEQVFEKKNQLLLREESGGLIKRVSFWSHIDR
jgi:hypothetical protein